MTTWRLKRGLEAVLVAAAIGFVVWFYHWTVAANNGFDNWGDLDYFRLLVRGWKKGQLHMDIAPRPELLALPDPYDPLQNEPYKLGDATLYRGRYYLYFGAAPAATLMLPYTLITGREMPMGAATFVFATIAFVTASGLFLAVRRRYFPNSAAIIAPLGVLALGFGTHLLSLAQRPMIWELPIAGGVAFTLLAIVGCYRAVHGRHPVIGMAVAGLCLGLAVGSRPTCLFAAPLLLAPIWFAWREGKPGRQWWRKTIAAALPLGLCGLAIMAHNYARFENPFEFGQNYQLSGAYEGKLTHFSARFFLHNLYVYFFQPLAWTWEFPFAFAEKVEVGMPGGGYMGTEEVCGIAVTFFFLWFGFVLPLAWRERERDERRRLLVVLGCVAGYALPVGALLLAYFSTCARYQADFAVAFGLLAVFGLLGVERRAQSIATPVRRRLAVGAVNTLAVAACVVTVVLGALISFDYHGRALKHSEPLAWQTMDRVTHAWLARAANALGAIEGPRILKVRFKPQPAGTVEPFWQPADPRLDETILLEHIGEHLIRFGYRREGRVLAWGRPLRWETDHTHTVHVQVPSLYAGPPPRSSGLMGRYAFRERTGVAVWFSGGRALGLVAPPVPASSVAGGAVSPNFSGELRSIGQRVFREDEIGPVGLAERDARRGGTLKMTVHLPHNLRAQGEPLFACGAHYRSTLLYAVPVPGGVQFYYHNYAHNPLESAVVPRTPGPMEIEFETATFRPEAFGDEKKGDVVLRVNGVEVLRTVDVCYAFPWGDEAYGRNPFGTNCEPDFRGWILNARWSAGETASAAERR